MPTLATESNQLQMQPDRFRSCCAEMFAVLADLSGFMSCDFDPPAKWKDLMTSFQEWGWLPDQRLVRKLLFKSALTGEELGLLSCWLIQELGNPHRLISFTRLIGQNWRSCQRLVIGQRGEIRLVATGQPIPGQPLIGNPGCSRISAPQVAYDLQRHSFLVF